MPRPLRLDYPGAWFHVTARGNERRAIYHDAADRLKFIDLLARARRRFGIVCHAYCLMGNHYHLVVESADGRLSEGMQLVNGSYGRYINRRRDRVGHLFQGRFQASLIERDTYLLEAVRYVELNPCRASLVTRPELWPWSSFRPRTMLADVPDCLCVTTVLEQFGPGRPGRTRYIEFVCAGLSEHSPRVPFRDKSILGSHAFLARHAERARQQADHRRVPSRQRLADRPPLDELLRDARDRWARRRGAVAACLAYGYKMTDVARHLGVHYTTISRWVRAAECDDS